MAPNELTHEVAAALGANPIITTASDVQKTIPVDLFGARFGWVWDSADKLTPVSASVVNEEHVAIVQETVNVIGGCVIRQCRNK
ncbi:hypothetical protein LSPH24S_00378 [Lysinibacillus sphaericus]